jgi:methionine-rich copper-binding protein CopC
MTRISTFLLASVLCLALACGQAFAHATLDSAIPGAGSTVASPPKEIRLKFSEGVEAALSKVSVTGPAGKVSAGSPHAAGKDKSTLVASLPGSLKPGTYKVQWRAVSVDSHHTEGNFTFTVRP